MRWLQTLFGMGPARDLRAEILARPKVYPPAPPRLLGMSKPHMYRSYSLFQRRHVWHATQGMIVCSGDTPEEAYGRLKRRCPPNWNV